MPRITPGEESSSFDENLESFEDTRRDTTEAVRNWVETPPEVLAQLEEFGQHSQKPELAAYVEQEITRAEDTAFQPKKESWDLPLKD